MASIGPQIPSHILKKKDISDDEEEHASPPSVGPQIPSHITQKIAGPQVPDDDSDDEYGPALPPDLIIPRNTTSANASQQPKPEAPQKRIVGPSFPTGPPPDDDDDYGPTPLPPSAHQDDGPSEGVREFMEKEERRRKELEVSL